MSQKKHTQISNDEQIVTVMLLEELSDGTLRVGNSHECSISEATAMIKEKRAKGVDCPIGVMPIWVVEDTEG